MPTYRRTLKVMRRKSAPTISKRALNRALLARQLLLQRSDMKVRSAIDHLVGLQAQTPNAPYLVLWSRLANFSPELLTVLIQERRVVRVALMRGTIHSVTDEDCLELRPHFDSVLLRGMRGAFGSRLEGLNLKEIEATARKLLRRDALTFAELGKRLATR